MSAAVGLSMCGTKRVFMCPPGVLVHMEQVKRTLVVWPGL